MAEHSEDLARKFMTSRYGDRDALWKLLAGWIELWARRIARNDTPQLRDEFVGDASGKVWTKLKEGQYDPEKGSFRTWACAVLRNDRTDRLRQYRRHQEAMSQYTNNHNCEEEPHRLWMGAEQDGQADLSEKDLERIQSWKARQGLHLSIVAGNLWWRLPRSLRERWLDELGFPRDAVPDGLKEVDSRRERNAFLAELFGVTRQCLNTWFQRCKHLLDDLDLFRRRR